MVGLHIVLFKFADHAEHSMPASSTDTGCALARSLISYLYPARSRELLEALQQKRMTAISMDMIPRTISRAQSFDSLRWLSASEEPHNVFCASV